jgi:hypothetical protein
MIHLYPVWQLKPEPISVVHPSRQYLSLKVRKFIHFLVKKVEKFKIAVEQLPTPGEPLVAYKQLIEDK